MAMWEMVGEFAKIHYGRMEDSVTQVNDKTRTLD